MIFTEAKMKALMKEAIKEGLDELVAKHVLATMQRQVVQKGKADEEKKKKGDKPLHKLLS